MRNLKTDGPNVKLRLGSWLTQWAAGVAVSRQSLSKRNQTHRTPHSPTLITAGVEDNKILNDTFIGGKFKGVWHCVEWHYGSAEKHNLRHIQMPRVLI
jgi:hypothetical protein